MNILFNKTDQDLEVLVLEAEKTLYKGRAQSISSENDHGKFDILAGHQSFISIIKNLLVIQLKNNKNIKFNIDKGVLKCTDNKVEIIIGMETI